MGTLDSFDEILAKDLNGKLENARCAYYTLADPIMTDAEYDTLEAQLRGMVQANPKLASVSTVLTEVGSDITPSVDISVATSAKSSGRVKHIRPMLSIENQYSKDDIKNFYTNLPEFKGIDAVVDVEPKRDGISAELVYVNGHLKQALTRGTGTEGEDMTVQVKALRNVPQFLVKSTLLDTASEIRIRGELVMRDSELDRINAEAVANGLKTYASTRNLTAGTMKQKDLAVVSGRDIIFMPWDVYSPTEDDNFPDSAYDRMKLLETAGFPKYNGVKVCLASEVVSAVDTILDLNAKSDIRADGVVIKVDSHKLRKQLGVSSKFTNWMTCYKPQSASGTTYLRDIIWQVGRQGALTPVAICDPVVLAGASVTRATLNNETWITTMGLTLGSKISMLRSGDVIPQIVKVIDDSGEPIVIPTECPECGKPVTVWTDKSSGITTRFCDNVECPGRVRGTLSYIGSRDILEIDGLADDMAGKIAKAGYARNLGELFEFQVEALGELTKLKAKFGEKQGEDQFITRMANQGFSIVILRMLKSMENAKTAGWDKWIAALGIPFVGRTLGKLLAKELKLDSLDMQNLCQKLLNAADSNIEGLGEVKNGIIKSWALDPVNREICMTLFNSGVRPTSTVVKVAEGTVQPLTGIKFCITGTFDEDRESISAKLESLGAVAKSGVSKNCNLLICGSDCGKSKLQKAESFSISMVKEDWLVQTFSKYGVSFKHNSGCAVEEI